jgi:acyl-CoA synthetase (AMP-forming)/AMP-acid ligase II
MIDWWGDVINEDYASSETGYLTLITSKEARERPGSAGRPIPGVSLKIIDDDGREAPPGTIGKVCTRPTGLLLPRQGGIAVCQGVVSGCGRPVRFGADLGERTVLAIPRRPTTVLSNGLRTSMDARWRSAA